MKDSKYLLHWLTLDPKEWHGVIPRLFSEEEKNKIDELIPFLSPPWEHHWQKTSASTPPETPKNLLCNTLDEIMEAIGEEHECEKCVRVKQIVREGLKKYKKRKGGAFVVTDEDATYKKRKKKVEVSENQIALNL